MVKKQITLGRLKKLPWDKFEQLSLELFEAYGWRAKGNEQKGSDGGIDIWMSRRGEKAIVQCKRYADTKVTVKVIREMWGLKHAHSVGKVYVITSSTFTKECYQFAKDKEIVLINGLQMVKLINKI